MSPTDGLFLYCAKRNQRISVSVCIFRQCSHLKEAEGEFSCKFKPIQQKKLAKKERRD